MAQLWSVYVLYPASILYKSIAGRYRPVSYPDGPITARYMYRFIKNAYWVSVQLLIPMHSNVRLVYSFLVILYDCRLNGPIVRKKHMSRAKQNVSSGVADCKGPDQTAQARSLIRAFTIRPQNHWLLQKIYDGEQMRLWYDTLRTLWSESSHFANIRKNLFRLTRPILMHSSTPRRAIDYWWDPNLSQNRLR